MSSGENGNPNGRRVYKSKLTPGGQQPANGQPEEMNDGPVQPQKTATAETGKKPGKGPKQPQKPGPQGRRILGLTVKQFTLIACAVGLVVVLLVGLLLSVFVFNAFGTGGASTSTSWALSSSSTVDDDYDRDVNSIDEEKYQGTVLADMGEDAGDDYVADTLFIGDSNTERMLSYRNVTNVTMLNGIGITNMGITDVTSLKCVKFQGEAAVAIPEAMAIMQPQRIVINYGTNNATMNTDSFVDNYKTAIEAIQSSWPYADIIIASIFPVTKNHTYGNTLSQTKLDEMNLALVELAKEMDLKFLNWGEALRDKDGFCNSQYMLADGVHLNEVGMKAIFEYMRSHSYITEDRRPQPVDTSWVREGTPAGLFPGASSSSSSSATSTSSSSTTSSSSSSSSQSGKVKVVFTAGTGGQLQSGGVTQSSMAVQLAPGATTGAVTAIPNSGYTFSGWSASSGTVGSSATITYTIPSDAAIDSTITLTATFTATVTSYTVPSVVGTAFSGSYTDGSGVAWTVVKASDAYSSSVAAGNIISQDPAAGTATQNLTISVVVSLGPEPVASYTVPNVVGTAFSGSYVDGSGVTWTVAKSADAYSSTVVAGSIISQDPAAGSTTQNLTITVVVSLGPEPAATPSTP